MNFLDKVLPVKQREVEILRKGLSDNPFARLFENSKNKPVFITEIKPQSPSAGQLIHGDPLNLVSAYEQGGADAISVLTDKEFFGGSKELFTQVRKITNLPLLRKEFVIDESQVLESLQLRADAILLIVQLLSPKKLTELIHFSKLLGIVPLVEIISEEELAIAIQSKAQFIGVNSRNLRTMEVNQDKALMLLGMVPSSVHKLLFSGIETENQIKVALQAGTEGFLIGTSLLRATKPDQKLLQLRKATERNYVN
jgi:indole-3-glycerol phosphate synthase